MSAPTVDERLAGVEEAVAGMQQTMNLVLLQLARSEDEDGRAPQTKDEPWCCASCSAKLGVYNRERDEMRIRYKEMAVYVIPGVGGSLMMPCRRCGELNSISATNSQTGPVAVAR